MTPQNKRIKRAIIIPFILLIIPFVASQFIEGWNWHWNEYLFAYGIWTVFALIYVRLTKNTVDSNRRILIGVAVFLVLAFIWVVLATG